MTILIGITGYFGTGKSTLANLIIQANDRIKLSAFADELKRDVHTIYADLLGETFTNLNPAEIEVLKPMCLGLLYQGHGELMRQLLGFDYWIRRLEPNLPEAAVIHDTRYPNEAEWVKQRGGLMVGVTGPNRRMNDTRNPHHESEIRIPEVLMMCDRVYDNSANIHGLYTAAESIVQEVLSRERRTH